LDIAGTDSGIEIADIGLASDAGDQIDAAEAGDADVESLDELDWLSDPAFADEEALQEGIEIQMDMGIQSDVDVQTDSMAPELQTKSGATQQLGSLLGEFVGEETIQVKVSEDVLNEGAVDAGDDLATTEAITVESQSQATQDLDSLLTDFTEQDDTDEGLIHLEAVDEPDVKASATTDDAFEAGATQHLDNLLGEFSDDDDDLSFISTQDDFDAGIIEQGRAVVASSGVDTIGLDTDHGATQELDSLLSEFADEDDGLSFIEPIDVATAEQPSFTGTDALDHGATQELDNLLGEFIEADNVPAESDNMDHSATQVLGHLLDEFSDDDEDDKKD